MDAAAHLGAVAVDGGGVDVGTELGGGQAEGATPLAALIEGSWLDRLDTKQTSSGTVLLIPVHVGGLMMDIAAVHAFARRHGLWVIEDAAHTLPAAWRAGPDRPWQRAPYEADDEEEAEAGGEG